MRIFLDSNIFIEQFKGNRKASSLLERVIGEELYINEVVYSEVAYISIRMFSEKFYPDLKKNRELVSAAGKKFIELMYPILKLANFLEINRECC
jgi:predicted nucleic acid-binding protein